MSESRYKKRLVLLAATLCLLALGVAARLVFVQVIGADAYQARAHDQHEGNIRIEGPRGTLWERNGRELAVSVATKSLYVHPYQIRSPAEKNRIVSGVASVLGQPESAIRALIDNPRNRKFVFLKRRLSPREIRAIQERDIPGIGWMDDTRRFYPRGVLAAHVLGFVDIDGKGRAGIERAFDDVARGEPTTFLSLVDARQRPLLLRTTASGRPGRDLVLTLDETIQHLADEEIDRAMEETGAKAGTVIVMDPRTGEILALSNRPVFDPNRPGASPGPSRENIAVSYGYEPGSTFKIITAAAALEEGRARPGDLFDCGMGSITLFGRRIGDHHPYATLSLTQVIARSSNVGIIRVGQRLSERVFCDYVKRFGFGRTTGVALPSEAPGVVQRPGGRTWSGLSQAMMSMGQSIVVTPLQMLVSVSAIASGGERHAPRIVRSITSPDGTPEEVPSPAPTRVISRGTALVLTRMMETVLDEGGTGQAATIPGYRVAGKTGTAQKVVGGLYSHTAHVASFVGFAPSRNPALAAIVVLDEPSGKYYGGDVAAPTFARVVGPALAYLRVPPTEPIPPPPGPSQAALRARARARARAERASVLAGGDTEPPPRPFPARWPPSVPVSRGKTPDLFGMDLRDALTLLTRSGCTVRTSGSGFVVAQTPPPGTALDGSAPCTIELAPEPPEDHGAGQGS